MLRCGSRPRHLDERVLATLPRSRWYGSASGSPAGRAVSRQSSKRRDPRGVGAVIADASRDLQKRPEGTLEQAALRRIATLVAQGVEPHELFAVVAEEVGGVIDAPSVADMVGDGVFATFDGPARAVRCAPSIADGLEALGLGVRAGVHTGEVEQADDGPRGLAVHIAARIAAAAQPGEVIVSSTVKDIVAGSGIAFEERGERELDGVPGTWHLFSAQISSS